MRLLLNVLTRAPWLLAALGAGAVQAAEPLSFNLGLTSDYRYRGISQSRLKPAVQGGVDYAASNGLYVGAWASTIRWVKDAGGGSSAELDVYGGYKFEIQPGLTLDLGLLQYIYPRHDLHPSPSTLEVYGALSAGPVSLKLSRSGTSLFGFADSQGSLYADLSATVDLGQGWSLAPHLGHQTVRRQSPYSYTDWSLALNKEASGATWSLAWVDTNTRAYVGAGGKDLGQGRLLLSAKWVF